MKILCDSQSVLYVADPQAKLLLSILSLPNLCLPQESYPFFLRLLYIWVRKSSKQSSLMIDSMVEVLFHIFSEKFNVSRSSVFFSEGVLLLGAVSFTPSVSEKSKTVCLELLCKLLEEEYQLIGLSGGPMPSVLAGIGYALFSSGKMYFVRVLDSLFEIWEKTNGPCGSVPHGLMILHLIEWVLSNCVLPILMKLLAQLVVQLPKDGQTVILGQLFQHVAESDDVTRKPTLVSWLQSLSYLCSQATNKRAIEGMQIEAYAASMNSSSSRL